MKFIYLGCFLIICDCAIAGPTLEIPEYLKIQAKRLHDRCKLENGVTDDSIKMMEVGQGDRKMQCYTHCLFDKVGLIDENNVVHLNNLLEILPTQMHSTIQHLGDTCGTKPGADGCETAFLTVKCYFETDPTLKEQISLII